METNETILTRKAVGLDDRKALGKVSDLRVDCDTLGVCHYIVSSASTNSSLVLPFEKALAVGDTFMTVQSRNDFLPLSDEALGIVNDGFRLVGSEVYSKTGNRLGIVASYGFDPVFGKVTELVLDSKATFAADQLVFFSPEFVFVDDGERTAAELRSADIAADQAEEEVEAVPEAESAQLEELEEEFEEEFEESEEESEEESDEDEPEEELEEEPVEAQPELADEDAELVIFLLGQTTAEDVVSADGEFMVPRGTVLTSEMLDEARAHDALLLLTMSVDA